MQRDRKNFNADVHNVPGTSFGASWVLVKAG